MSQHRFVITFRNLQIAGKGERSFPFNPLPKSCLLQQKSNSKAMSKSAKPVRTKLVQIRVTEEEKTVILTNAKGNVSDWFRAFGLNPKSPHHKPQYRELKQDPEVVRQLAFIGNNVNQFARQVNTIKKSGGLLNLVAIQAQLVQVNKLLERMAKPKR